ncbi:MAG: sigma-70 family RNA polymerase sigma factor [Planctomycetota bacterium]
MTSDSISVRAEALLHHRDFVVRLAQGLVQGFPRAPRAHRTDWVEFGDTEEELRDGLALQQKVVQTVLGLDEPYRTILLLRYYARLSVSEIAERRGDTDPLVRAQLARAIELLRAALDAQYAGGREAWASGLLALSRKRRALVVLVKSAALAAIAAAVAIPAYVALVPKSGEALRVPPFPAVTVDPVSGEIASIESLRAALATRTIPELIQVAVQTQRTLRHRLLDPPAGLLEARPALFALPSTGLARILHRGQLGNDDVNVLGLSGAGSCFSFATLEHGFDAEPDLVLEQGHFISIGEGPGVLDLGFVRLEDLSGSETPIPPELNISDQQAWRVFWANAIDPVKGLKPAFTTAVRALRVGPATPVPGHSYLVRGLVPGRHDVLAAFEAIAEDEHGWTIAWRVLRITPIGEKPPRREDPYWWVPPPPAWHGDLGVDPLIDVLAETRKAAEALLFELPEDLRSRYRASLLRPGTKLLRLLAGERYSAAVAKPGAGASFSFAKGEHVDDRDCDLRLDGEKYVTRLEPRACSVLLDFGLRALELVPTTRSGMPDDLSPAGREIWEILWTLKAVDKGALARAVLPVEETRIQQFAPERSMEAKIGHTYLLRSIVAGDHDVLVAFSLAARDEHGDWILWREIWNRKLAATVKKPAPPKGKKPR